MEDPLAMIARSQPRAAALPREVAMRLAATEYQRFADLLRALRPGDWTRPTDCPGWDVRAMAAHTLGMVEMAASIRETTCSVGLLAGAVGPGLTGPGAVGAGSAGGRYGDGLA